MLRVGFENTRYSLRFVIVNYLQNALFIFHFVTLHTVKSIIVIKILHMQFDQTKKMTVKCSLNIDLPLKFKSINELIKLTLYVCILPIHSGKILDLIFTICK